MITGKEFTLEQCEGLEFRVAYCSPVELLALNAQADFDQYKPTLTMFTYALEHVEVKVNNNWVPVKARDREVYMPLGIESNLAQLNAIVMWFVSNIVAQVFQDSRE